MYRTRLVTPLTILLLIGGLTASVEAQNKNKRKKRSGSKQATVEITEYRCHYIVTCYCFGWQMVNSVHGGWHQSESAAKSAAMTAADGAIQSCLSSECTADPKEFDRCETRTRQIIKLAKPESTQAGDLVLCTVSCIQSDGSGLSVVNIGSRSEAPAAAGRLLRRFAAKKGGISPGSIKVEFSPPQFYVCRVRVVSRSADGRTLRNYHVAGIDYESDGNARDAANAAADQVVADLKRNDEKAKKKETFCYPAMPAWLSPKLFEPCYYRVETKSSKTIIVSRIGIGKDDASNAARDEGHRLSVRNGFTKKSRLVEAHEQDQPLP